MPKLEFPDNTECYEESDIPNRHNPVFSWTLLFVDTLIRETSTQTRQARRAVPIAL